MHIARFEASQGSLARWTVAAERASKRWEGGRRKFHRAAMWNLAITTPVFLIVVYAALRLFNFGDEMVAFVLCILALRYITHFVWEAAPHRYENRWDEWQSEVRDETPHTITLGVSELGVDMKTQSSRFSCTWSHIEEIVDAERIIAFRTNDSQYLVLPKSSIMGISTDGFLADCRAWSERQPSSRAEAIARFLADKHLPCAGCRYDLMGIRGIACPECGEPLDLLELNGRFADRQLGGRG